MLEYINITGTTLVSSRIALVTWAIGGWMWGGPDEKESIRTIHAALDQGINLIDTAPIYGQGRSEEIVGEAVRQHGHRESIILATKAGVDWTNGKIERNSTRQRILQEFEDSLRRLQTDYIDVYQVHWPDPLVPIEETAATLRELYEQGKIRAIGVSNHSPEQMARFETAAPLHTIQPGGSEVQNSDGPDAHRLQGERKLENRATERPKPRRKLVGDFPGLPAQRIGSADQRFEPKPESGVRAIPASPRRAALLSRRQLSHNHCKPIRHSGKVLQ